MSEERVIEELDAYSLMDVIEQKPPYMFSGYVGPHGLLLPMQLIVSACDKASMSELVALKVPLRQYLIAALGRFFFTPGPKTTAAMLDAIAHRCDAQPNGDKLDARLAKMIGDERVWFAWLLPSAHCISTSDPSRVARMQYDQSMAYAVPSQKAMRACALFGDSPDSRFLFSSRGSMHNTHVAVYYASIKADTMSKIDACRQPVGSRLGRAWTKTSGCMPKGLNIISRSAGEGTRSVGTINGTTKKAQLGYQSFADTINLTQFNVSVHDSNTIFAQYCDLAFSAPDAKPTAARSAKKRGSNARRNSGKKARRASAPSRPAKPVLDLTADDDDKTVDEILIDDEPAGEERVPQVATDGEVEDDDTSDDDDTTDDSSDDSSSASAFDVASILARQPAQKQPKIVKVVDELDGDDAPVGEPLRDVSPEPEFVAATVAPFAVLGSLGRAIEPSFDVLSEFADEEMRAWLHQKPVAQ